LGAGRRSQHQKGADRESALARTIEIDHAGLIYSSHRAAAIPGRVGSARRSRVGGLMAPASRSEESPVAADGVRNAHEAERLPQGRPLAGHDGLTQIMLEAL